MLEGDTIAAVSTPPGEAGIGVIRISGPEALAIARSLFSRGIPDAESHRIYYGFVIDPQTRERVDEALLSVMLAPRTYTREDVVEISCHGGPLPVGRVMELALRAGARLAGPGEFTRRAFMNGRIDLAQAEAALDIIRARSEDAERIALAQLRGGLSSRVGDIRQRLLEACAQIEAHIDFPEDEIEPSSMNEALAAMDEIASDVKALAATFDAGRLYSEGVRIAIVGRPNVGKSSLLNRLLERDRAIVTEIPGTTRDVIEEPLTIGGLPVRIMDTAGIRQSHEMVEREGVRRSLEALEGADIALGVIDASSPLHEEDALVLEKLAGKRALIALNKSDIMNTQPPAIKMDLPTVSVSARTGQGIDELRASIYKLATTGRASGDMAEGAIVTNARHRAALSACARSLDEARDALCGRRPLEIVALEMRDALGHLGSIVGSACADDILDLIFSRFCIGK